MFTRLTGVLCWPDQVPAGSPPLYTHDLFRGEKPIVASETDTRGDGPESGVGPWNLGALLEGFRPQLRRMVSLRLDPRLRHRFDSSDVLQEAFVEVTRRFEEYRARQDMPFSLWVRLITAQKLAEFHRRHLGTKMRDVRREEVRPAYSDTSSVSLARAIVAQADSPSQILVRKEQEERVRAALERMKAIDREILLLRHFEQLSTDECAHVLGLSPQGASTRHLRAAKRLHEILSEQTDL